MTLLGSLIMQIVDAYAHCGISKYEPINRVRATMATAGVDRAVLVQHMGEFDNTYLERVVAEDPKHLAGVCLVDHEQSDGVRELERWQKTGQFQGVRFTTDVCAAAPQLLAAADELNLIIVLYTPDGIADFVEPLESFLEAHPNARLVLTHLGITGAAELPDLDACREAFRLASFPGTYYQLSGMKMFCPYPHEPLHELIAEAAEHFGTCRMVWGSNYPPVGDTDDYVKDLHLLLDGKLPLPKSAIPDIVGGNALKLWFGK